MKNYFIKATCQISNPVVGKVCSLLSVMEAQGIKFCHLWAFGKSCLWPWMESCKTCTGRSSYKAVCFKGVSQNWVQVSSAWSMFPLSLFQTFISLRSYFRHSLFRILSTLIPSWKEFRKGFCFLLLFLLLFFFKNSAFSKCQDFFFLFDQVVRNFAIATSKVNRASFKYWFLLENQQRCKKVSLN